MAGGVKENCSVIGCDKPQKAKGLCRNHYEVNRRNGTPIPQTKKAQDFMALAISSETDDCIVWPFAKRGDYPTVRHKGKQRTAHRLILEICKGAPPTAAHQAAHLPVVCHNPMCINPRHLRWALPKENAQDQLADGTRRRGEQRHNAKLSLDEVIAIRDDVRSYSAVAQIYSISKQAVYRIKKGINWK